MSSSFFFYDLETSGFNPRSARVMQFGGQRTDLELRPIGEPVNLLLKLTDDCLPDVDAILITGITPQMTLTDGLSEVEFLKEFTANVATPGTIFVGYNSVRFDDEFMRFLHYRNFYDPYQWQWQDGRSRWDLLDVVRMTRALRPEGIKWPVDVHGVPTNRLELLAAINKLEHDSAHDALSDVRATIAVARLIRGNQPKLWGYLLGMRDKKKVAALVEAGLPFVYTSGKYPSEFEKTTVVLPIGPHPKKQGVLVYDLRHDPAEWLGLPPERLAAAWQWTRDEDKPQLPVKTLQFNRCPAVAPLQVLDKSSLERLNLDPKLVKSRAETLGQSAKTWLPKLSTALEILDKQQQATLLASPADVDSRLYDGFFADEDRQIMSVVRAARPEELDGLDFKDQRLEALLPLYKARNFFRSLSGEERQVWDEFRSHKLLSGGERSLMARFFSRLQEAQAAGGLTKHQVYLIEELRLYAESIAPQPE